MPDAGVGHAYEAERIVVMCSSPCYPGCQEEIGDIMTEKVDAEIHSSQSTSLVSLAVRGRYQKPAASTPETQGLIVSLT